jgi:hypothetical protein
MLGTHRISLLLPRAEGSCARAPLLIRASDCRLLIGTGNRGGAGQGLGQSQTQRFWLDFIAQGPELCGRFAIRSITSVTVEKIRRADWFCSSVGKLSAKAESRLIAGLLAELAYLSR